MSKKDYVALAAVLNNWYKVPEARTYAAAIALDMADVLAADNPRFDRERWIVAVRKDVDK